MTEALTAYRSALAASLERVDLRAISGMRSDAASGELPLARLYVLPRLRRRGDSEREDGASAPVRVAAEYRRVALYGGPGSGKSTLLRALCLACLREDDGLRARFEAGGSHRLTSLVPVWIRLSSFRPRRGRARALERFVRAELVAQFGAEAAEAALVALAGPEGLLCLDGLDEIPGLNDRQRAVRAIEEWARSDRRCWVSIREGTDLALAAGFTAWTLEGFSRTQAEEYAIRRAALDGLSEHAARLRGQKQIATLFADPGVAATARVPLSLAIALRLAAREVPLPAERVQLYAGVVDTLVGTWNAERRTDALRDRSGDELDPGLLLRGWAEVAWELHEESLLGGEVHRSEWMRRLTRTLGTVSTAEAALAVLSAQAGLLEPGHEGHLRFWHATFGEYLAALGLVARRRQGIGRTPVAPRSAEVARMAIAWARVDGDLPLADAMVDELLARAEGPGWARVFGTAARRVVECLTDGHPVADPRFLQIVEQVVMTVEHAPTRANGDALEKLARLRPDASLPPALALRIAGLADPAQGRRLSVVTLGPLARWLSPHATREPVVLACLKTRLAQSSWWSPHWIGVALLRAGVVEGKVCEAILHGASADLGWVGRALTKWTEMAGALVGLDASTIAALRTLLERPDTGAQAAAVLALVGDDTQATMEALRAAATADSADDTALAALAWLACTRPSARAWLCAALIADASREDGSRRVERLERSIRAAAQHLGDEAGVLATALVDALADAPSATPAPAVMAGDRRVALRSLLSQWAYESAAMRGTFAAAATPATRVGWFIATVVWEPGLSIDLDAANAAYQTLIAAVADADATLAAASAVVLSKGWDRLPASGQARAATALVRGLAEPELVSACVHVLSKFVAKPGAPGHEQVLAALTSEVPLQAVAAAQVLSDTLELAGRCAAMFERALAGDDPELAARALRVYRYCPALPIAGEVAALAALRLWFAGAVRFRDVILGVDPPTRPVLEYFLDAPRTASEDGPDGSITLELDWWASWLSTHVDALDLALASVGGERDPARVEALLARSLRDAAAVERAVEVGLARGAESLVDAALRWRQVRDEKDPAVTAAIERGRFELLRPDLQAGELAVVHAATRDLYIRGDQALLATARRRVLLGGTPQERVEQVRRLLGSHFSDELDPLCRWCFELAPAGVADALRPCTAEGPPKLRLLAGALMWRLTGEAGPLQSAAWFVLNAPSPPDDAEDDEVESRWLLPLRAWDALGVMRGISGSKLQGLARNALFALPDAATASYMATLCEEAFASRNGWGWQLLWFVLKHHPTWWDAFEPVIARSLLRDPSNSSRFELGQLRKYGALTPGLLAAAAERWARWLYEHEFPQTFAEFIAGPEALPSSVIAEWEQQVHASPRSTCGPAALALAYLGQADERVAGVLVDLALPPVGPGSGLALRFIEALNLLPRLQTRLRDLTTQASTAEQANELLELWAWGFDPSDGALLARLLHLVLVGDDPAHVAQAAFALAAWDAPAARAALERLVGLPEGDSGVDAAVWLVAHAMTSAAAVARLLAVVRAGPPHHWTRAAIALFNHDRADPDLQGALFERATLGDIDEREALWLLAAAAGPQRALTAVLERMAQKRWRASEVPSWAALARGELPGKRPTAALWSLLGTTLELIPEVAAPDVALDDESWFMRSLQDGPEQQSWRLIENGEVLVDQAEGWKMLPAEDVPDVSALMASPFSGIPDVLRRRLTEGNAAVAESIVHAALGDDLGRRLARLYWLLNLDEDRTNAEDDRWLDLNQLHDRPRLFIEILRAAYPSDSTLRIFVDSLGPRLADGLRGPSVSFDELVHDAAALLIRRKLQDEAVRRARCVPPRLRARWDALSKSTS